MRVGRWHIRKAALAVTAFLLVSSVAVACLAANELGTEGMAEAWSYSEKDRNGWPNDYRLLMITGDGTILARETLHSWTPPESPVRLLALSPDGSVRWRFDNNAFPELTEGPDGNLYYVDSVTPSWSAAPDSGGGILTALGPDGVMRWGHTVTNGTLVMLRVSPDGTVAAHHYDRWYDQDAQMWTVGFDRIIAIDGDGSVRWNISNPLPGSPLTNGRWASNGTFLVNAYADNTTYEIGINGVGSDVYVMEVRYYTGGHFYETGLDGTTEYLLKDEPIDLEHREVSVVALDITTGEELWRTGLYTADNPAHNPPGAASFLWTVFSGGRVYCDGRDGNTYCLSPSGEVLWSRPYLGLLWAAHPSGGVLATEGPTVKRVSADGSTAWAVDTGSERSGPWSVLVSPDGTVYHSDGTSIDALARSGGLSASTAVIIAVVLADAVVVAHYVLTRKGRKSG